MQTKLTFFQGDSHANHLVKPEKEEGPTMIAIYGQKCLEQFEKLNPDGLWEKTFAELLVGQMVWFSTKSVLTWKLKATMSKRLLFQLQASTLRTKENEFGLLPTPRAGGQEGYQTRAKRKGHNSAMSYLESAVDFMSIKGLLPTPTAMDCTNATARMNSNQLKTGSMHSVTLSRALSMGILPTPTANDMKNKTLPISQLKRNDSIVKRILIADSTVGRDSQLNPRFVLEMMGFPSNWTELPFLNGDQNL